MNQLQAVAMNEGYRWKKKLFSAQGRALLEKLSLAPWASRRRKELLELMDQLDPKIAELTAAVEQEANQRPEALLLMTHPGVGPHHRAGLRSRHWNSGAVSLRQEDLQLHLADSV
jgi:transposase